MGRSPAVIHTAPEASAYVASLGNLRTGQSTGKAQAELATFLFGVEPDAPIGLIKPLDVIAADDELWVCDGALQAVLRWMPDSNILEAAPLVDPPTGPVAITADVRGDRLIAGENGAVVRHSTQGRPTVHYTPPVASEYRVGGIACIGEEVWVSNVRAHRIEVFDAASGVHRRSIGQRGRGPLEFGFPLDLTVGRDGNIYVVDMLNARVQVLDRAGGWVRDIGGPGDRIGKFGRPKAVAIGPDGTVFVVDAASQCVHAFDEDGRALLTFGGTPDREDALVLPAGITIWTGKLDAARELPSGFQPAYYVLVAEQIVRPGLRVYAWSGSRTPPEPTGPKGRESSVRLVASVENPHWRPDRCTACHARTDGAPRAIDASKVDGLCLSCHDGKKAIDEAHPIGRPGRTASTQVPVDWPLVGERLGCLTCHDIRKHCKTTASRPLDNPALVRGFDAHNPLTTCTTCHISREWRVNPHRSDVAGMSAAAACGFCHVSTPRSMESGWVFDGALRDSPSQLCQSCHTMHADPAPQGHLGAVVSQPMLQTMIEGERDRGIRDVSDRPQLLPLDNGRVACSTCHNPHAPDAIPAEVFRSPTAFVRSMAPTDAGKALRIEHMSLCRYCHAK
jgi:predicted CXXCH cytochrome family protein